jgi:hypothetical protein
MGFPLFRLYQAEAVAVPGDGGVLVEDVAACEAQGRLPVRARADLDDGVGGAFDEEAAGEGELGEGGPFRVDRKGGGVDADDLAVAMEITHVSTLTKGVGQGLGELSCQGGSLSCRMRIWHLSEKHGRG